MLPHFKPKEQGWDKEQDDAWKEKVAEFIAEKYLPLAIVESASFREMIGALNPKAQIPSRTGIKRIMENMRVDLNEEVQLSFGDTQGATMWVHKGADLELYS